jgi:Zn-finger nucleic acid-binding protein
MECPNKHKGELKKIHFHNVEVDYCEECLGIWFDKDELRFAKDDKDKQLNWLDFDIWRDKSRFTLSKSQKLCPVCRVMFTEVNYDDSKVKIDFCKHCNGIWLDRGEFKQIMVYLKRKADYEILHKYAKNLILEMWEVFTGPEKFREELEDFLMLIKLFNYKFVVQHPLLNSWIEDSQK